MGGAGPVGDHLGFSKKLRDDLGTGLSVSQQRNPRRGFNFPATVFTVFQFLPPTSGAGRHTPVKSNKDMIYIVSELTLLRSLEVWPGGPQPGSHLRRRCKATILFDCLTYFHGALGIWRALAGVAFPELPAPPYGHVGRQVTTQPTAQS